MTEPTHGPDDDLDRILEAVDGPRELPPGAEDRLLAEILDTAATPRPIQNSTHQVLHVSRPAPKRWWSTGLAAAVLTIGASAAIVAGVVLVASEPRPPTILVEQPADNATLCSDAHDLVAELRLDEPGVPVNTSITSLRELADLLDEFASRINSGALTPSGGLDEVSHRTSTAAATLRLQARQLEQGNIDAAARTRLRSAFVVLHDPPVLEELGCTSTGG